MANLETVEMKVPKFWLKQLQVMLNKTAKQKQSRYELASAMADYMLREYERIEAEAHK